LQIILCKVLTLVYIVLANVYVSHNHSYNYYNFISIQNRKNNNDSNTLFYINIWLIILSLYFESLVYIRINYFINLKKLVN